MARMTWFAAAMVALAVVVIALLTILAVWYLFPATSVKSSAKSFDFTGNLTTSPMNTTNPSGCGSINTVAVFSLRSDARIFYNVSVDLAGTSLNYWIENGTQSPLQGGVAYGTTSEGEVVLGTNPPSVEFIFQGCGSMPKVPYTLWGTYTPGNSG